MRIALDIAQLSEWYGQNLEHDPEKAEPIFGKDHAPIDS
jgi:hypothetical protein